MCSSKWFIKILVLIILEVLIKPLMEGTFGLTYMLEATNFAGQAMDNVVAFAANFVSGRIFHLTSWKGLVLKY